MFVGAIGVFALAVAALFTIAAISERAQRWSRSQWPQVRATITKCEVRQLKRRKSVGGFYYRAECSATFTLNGKTETGGFASRSALWEHRKADWGDPGIDELRAWVAQHPPGSVVIARSDPEWTQTLVLDPTPRIFTNDFTIDVAKIAATAAIIGFALLALAVFVGR